MRSLGTILLCLFLFLLARGEDCQWKMPPEHKTQCEQIINWKAHTDEQATATCLEYFPTTFVDGEINLPNKNQIKCTVYRQFQCGHLTDPSLHVFSMFDKCYAFKTPATEVSLKEYLANPAAHCGPDGKLPVFLTMTQAKHIAKRAHMRGIFKMWVNLDKDGRLIEDSHMAPKGFLLYRDLWKVHEDNYWDGDELKKSPPGADGQRAPEFVANLFFRTNTDHVRNLWQGQFERATDATKASIVCEYLPKIVPELKRYCGKLGNLGLNAIYDETKGRKRCLYTSLSKYPMKGTEEAIKDFPGCKELPAPEHVAGLDDGTASKEAYDHLTKSGTYRVAAIKTDTSNLLTETYLHNFAYITRAHCQSSAGITDEIRKMHRRGYAVYDHFGQFLGHDENFGEYILTMSSPWAAEYPKNECSDFPTGDMESNTLAIRNKEIIDVPVPVRFAAICSIETNVDCQLKGQSNCWADQKCRNIQTWNAKTQLYAECHCVRGHTEQGSMCKWNESVDECGLVLQFEENGQHQWKKVKTGFVSRNTQSFHIPQKVIGAAVRRGCQMAIKLAKPGEASNAVYNIRYGQFKVANSLTDTFNGWFEDMRADQQVECTCSYSFPFHDPNAAYPYV